MKRVLVGIFAHPDDEAFGPSGTLLKLRDEGYDVHLILLTDGEAGTNPNVAKDLGALRLREWQAAGALLRANSLTALHLPDGALDKVSVDELDQSVTSALTATLSRYKEPLELSVMSFEPQGLTGHRDHIVATQIALRAYQAATDGTSVHSGEFWHYCLDSRQAPLEETPYYEPQAREDAFINRRVDVRAYLADKYTLMACHASQVADADSLKALGDDILATECFHVIS